jgi:uncharacterized membrane protein
MSMIVSAALVHLPLRVIAVFSVVMICGHDALDGVAFASARGRVSEVYPACRWFAAVKRRRDDWWLSYL